MKQTKHKIGYVTIDFIPEVIQGLVNWSKQIPEGDLFTMKINDKQEGGNVANDAHMTLFFGINDSKLNHEMISNYLANFQISKLQLGSLDAFHTKQPGCKILIIKINITSLNIVLKIKTNTKIKINSADSTNFYRVDQCESVKSASSACH